MIKSKSFLIQGTVQGVGFRPWVYRLAQELHLKGFVRNTAQGVSLEVEGADNDLAHFINKINTDLPSHCVVTSCQQSDVLPQGFKQFEILPSLNGNKQEALVLPDLSTCPECINEIFDQNDRRYLYPFTNCIHCGPRYSIIESLPYDRLNTSMMKFKMCPQCEKEYDNPLNRRFHAQPNACPNCGPKVSLWEAQGEEIATKFEAIPAVVDLIKRGSIIALKALGGFYLIADALNEDAVLLLRERKKRPHKPFALMMTSLLMANQYCEISDLESNLLNSAQSPIVLLSKKQNALKVSNAVAPGNPYLGCMLPSMPLLHIVSRILNRPLIATSGNLSEEPICIDNDEALTRLKGIADYFLVHDRPIVRQVDDSIIQVISNEATIIRRARGFAPMPIDIGKDCDGILAPGAHQKNTVALGLGNSTILSQHIGDLDNTVSSLAFEKVINSLTSIYNAPISKVVCDLHPDYTSSNYAHKLDADVLEVQHHHAHVASCIAEHQIKGDMLGVCWDGTGYGSDGTVWGGEFLIADGHHCRRIAHLNHFPLSGGDLAIKEPRRSALGLLFELCDGNWLEYNDLPCIKAFNAQELLIISRMIKQKVNSPMTSSIGRLFDGVASLIGLCHQSSFEAHAAMALEFQISDKFILAPYYYEILPKDYKNKVNSINLSSMIREIIEDFRAGRDASVISTRFHLTLIKIIVDMAYQANKAKVVLTGGCFQNKWLLENAIIRLKQEGFIPYWHKQVPTNDGGVSFGQMYIAANHFMTSSNVMIGDPQ